jgi:hypothetical protein
MMLVKGSASSGPSGDNDPYGTIPTRSLFRTSISRKAHYQSEQDFTKSPIGKPQYHLHQDRPASSCHRHLASLYKLGEGALPRQERTVKHAYDPCGLGLSMTTQVLDPMYYLRMTPMATSTHFMSTTLLLQAEMSIAETDFRRKVGFYKEEALSLHSSGEDLGQGPFFFIIDVGWYDRRRKALESKLGHTTTDDVIKDVLNRLDESHCKMRSLYNDERDLERFDIHGEGGTKVSPSWASCRSSKTHLNRRVLPRAMMS